MNANMVGDSNNMWITLERSAKRAGVPLHEFPLLRNGDPGQCVELLKFLLFFMSREVAADMIARKCTEHSPDKRIVLAAFDLIREAMKVSPGLTVEQFMGNVSYEYYTLFI